MIYRFSIFITGDSYTPITSRELHGHPLHVYSNWTKDDTFLRRGKCYLYNHGGSHLLHNSIFVENEEERAKIVEDYIHFLEVNTEVLKEHGATDVELAATIYMEKSQRFILLTQREMKELLHCGNVSVRLDILCMNKKELVNIKNYMIRERRMENEKL